MPPLWLCGWSESGEAEDRERPDRDLDDAMGFFMVEFSRRFFAFVTASCSIPRTGDSHPRLRVLSKTLTTLY
jgi:hypothetical protein